MASQIFSRKFPWISTRKNNPETAQADVLPIKSAAPQNVPQHIAIIMDGNNRWAKKRLMPGVSGHRAGVETIRKVLSVCEESGVKVLTLFAFSSENWSRPDNEVDELMKLLKTYLAKEVDKLHDKGVAIRFIGRRDRLDSDTVALMQAAEAKRQETLQPCPSDCLLPQQ